MFPIYLLLASIINSGNMILFDFNPDTNLNNWSVVDDDVMGGRSDGNIKIGIDGHAIFSGEVSLENNGGFSSLRYRFDHKDIADYNKIVIRLKGDGKRYQFRVKSNRNDRHSYIYYFQTTGEWQTVEIPIAEMKPSFRGKSLNMPNYAGNTLAEIAFLIANNKAERFKLEIDKIELTFKR